MYNYSTTNIQLKYNNINMTKRELTKLKKSLPPRYRTLLAQTTGYTKQHIDYVLSGERSNEKIIDAAIKLAHQYAITQAERKEKINQL